MMIASRIGHFTCGYIQRSRSESRNAVCSSAVFLFPFPFAHSSVYPLPRFSIFFVVSLSLCKRTFECKCVCVGASRKLCVVCYCCSSSSSFFALLSPLFVCLFLLFLLLLVVLCSDCVVIVDCTQAT